MPEFSELSAALADVDRLIDHEYERLYAIRAKTGDTRGWELVPTPGRSDGRLMKSWTVHEESSTQLIVEIIDFKPYTEELFRKIGAFGWVKHYQKYPDIRIYAIMGEPRPLLSGSDRKWFWTGRYVGIFGEATVYPPAIMSFPMRFGT